MTEQWQAVIGLEIHIELNTKTKLFGGSRNRFGDEPNTNIDCVSVGLPGSLPVLNRAAVEKAIAFGCALKAQIAPYSKFDRKSYFYPDSPRNYQITQLDQPLILGGEITTAVAGEIKVFKINRAHLEDDSGMLKHFTTFTGIDYNRAGVPLIEVVSEPCMHSAADAVAYAMAVRAIAQYSDISNCNMEEGSLRFDVNISLRKQGEVGLRPKIEIKNMNSFSSLEMAINCEIQRQIQLYEAHQGAITAAVVKAGTYRWDAESEQVILMRSKETAEDYRCFPEPDLPPLRITQGQIEAIRAQLPELPYEKKKRYIEQLQLSDYQATLLTNDKNLALYFEQGLEECGNARSLCNWITVEFAGRFKERGLSVYQSAISPSQIAELVDLIDTQQITGKIAKLVADDLMQNPHQRAREIVAANPDYQTLKSDGIVEKIVGEIILANPQSVADYRAGKQRALGFLVGQVMQRCGGKAPPALVNQLLLAHMGTAT